MKVPTKTIKTIGGNPHAAWYQNRHQTQDGLLNLAEELGNVSKACRLMGFSRDTSYRYQKAVEQGGIETLVDQSRRKANIKNRVDEHTEAADLAYAI